MGTKKTSPTSISGEDKKALFSPAALLAEELDKAIAETVARDGVPTGVVPEQAAETAMPEAKRHG